MHVLGIYTDPDPAKWGRSDPIRIRFNNAVFRYGSLSPPYLCWRWGTKVCHLRTGMSLIYVVLSFVMYSFWWHYLLSFILRGWRAGRDRLNYLFFFTLCESRWRPRKLAEFRSCRTAFPPSLATEMNVYLHLVISTGTVNPDWVWLSVALLEKYSDSWLSTKQSSLC